MVKSIKNRKFVLITALSAVLIIAGAAVVLGVTRPYAVYADGTKVSDPYVLKADGKELVLVEDKETAEKVVEAVVDEYSPDGAQINSIVIDKKLSVDSKELKRTEEPPTVLTEEEAVDYVLEQNQSDDPMFNVTISAEKGSLKRSMQARHMKKAMSYTRMKARSKVKANQVIRS
ncbi:MAG: hypothetical protein V8Q42_03270 [Anaerovoracaceae bacterium]